MAFSPVEGIFAAGDRKGVIRIYFYEDLFGSASKKSSVGGSIRKTEGELLLERKVGQRKRKRGVAYSTSLHWHAHSVNCLAFSEDGRHLFSGGKEGVMVTWQVENGKKDFLPRLGAGLEAISISADGRFFALKLADNSVKIVDCMRNKIVNVIHKLHLDKTLFPGTALSICPLDRRVASNSIPGSVQLFDCEKEHNSLELKIVPSNVISGSEANPILLPHISAIAFSPDGLWMATVDCRPINVIPGNTFERKEVTLRFHSYDAASGSYSLHTIANGPHLQKTKFIEFFAANSRKAITSDGTDFKIWVLTPKNTPKDKEEKSNKSVFDYFWKTADTSIAPRERKIRALKVSGDGSVFAIAHKTRITLWDSAELKVIGQLYCDEEFNSNDILKGLMFVGDYLVSWGSRFAMVWSVKSLSLCYRLDIGAFSEIFGLFAFPSPTDPKINLMGLFEVEKSLTSASVSFFSIDKKKIKKLNKANCSVPFSSKDGGFIFSVGGSKKALGSLMYLSLEFKLLQTYLRMDNEKGVSFSLS